MSSSCIPIDTEKLESTQAEFDQIDAVWADVTAKAMNLVDQLKKDLADQDAGNLEFRSEALKLLKSQLRDVNSVEHIHFLTHHIQAPESTLSPRGGDFAGAKYIAEADELLVELAQIDVTEVTVEKYVEVQQTAPINEAVVEATKDESVQSAIKELTVHITCLSLL